MKQIYYKPLIKIKLIECSELMDTPLSIPISSNEENLIIDENEVLVNKHSVWDEQYYINL